jgi:hypothetical protein
VRKEHFSTVDAPAYNSDKVGVEYKKLVELFGWLYLVNEQEGEQAKENSA